MIEIVFLMWSFVCCKESEDTRVHAAYGGKDKPSPICRKNELGGMNIIMVASSLCRNRNVLHLTHSDGTARIALI
jgi:hypothetical protein